MTQLDIHFESGREILNAYWGFLAGGGLTLARQQAPELYKDQSVVLHVHIGTRPEFAVKGRVARIRHDETVIAFDTDESQTRLLSAALSERTTDIEAHLTVCQVSEPAVAKAHLFELSEDGCCLRLRPEHGAQFAIGTEVVIEAPGFRISGCVIAARAQERCIIFGLGDDDAIEAVRACLQARH